MKILIVATNVDRYASGNLPTGLWLSELTHLYDKAKKQGYEVTIASPKGGNVPLDPESLKPLFIDKLSIEYLANKDFMQQLQHTPSIKDVANQSFDAIYLAGGHGTMYDFPDDVNLQSLIKKQYEAGKVVSAVCHGVCGLLNVKLSDGEYLIKDKEMTGFSWFEETLAQRKKEVPFNLEDALVERTSNYDKALFPMTSNVVTDGHLITGQNPFSSKKIAEVVIEKLKA